MNMLSRVVKMYSNALGEEEQRVADPSVPMNKINE